MAQLTVSVSIRGSDTFLRLFERYVKIIEKQTKIMENNSLHRKKTEIEKD